MATATITTTTVVTGVTLTLSKVEANDLKRALGNLSPLTGTHEVYRALNRLQD